MMKKGFLVKIHKNDITEIYIKKLRVVINEI